MHSEDIELYLSVHSKGKQSVALRSYCLVCSTSRRPVLEDSSLWAVFTQSANQNQGIQRKWGCAIRVLIFSASRSPSVSEYTPEKEKRKQALNTEGSRGQWHPLEYFLIVSFIEKVKVSFSQLVRLETRRDNLILFQKMLKHLTVSHPLYQWYSQSSETPSFKVQSMG